MSKRKKISIVIIILIFVVGAWYAYQISNAKPVEPMASDGAKGARNFMEYQLELQGKGEIK